MVETSDKPKTRPKVPMLNIPDEEAEEKPAKDEGRSSAREVERPGSSQGITSTGTALASGRTSARAGNVSAR